jgi:hypothetical protein
MVIPDTADLGSTLGDGKTDVRHNRSRIEFAKRAIEELAATAVRSGGKGSIGVEIPFKDGVLGKVKQVQLVSSRE